MDRHQLRPPEHAVHFVFHQLHPVVVGCSKTQLLLGFLIQLYSLLILLMFLLAQKISWMSLPSINDVSGLTHRSRHPRICGQISPIEGPRKWSVLSHGTI